MDLNLNYQISVFGDFGNIAVSTETMIALESALQEYDFVPSTFLEDNASIQQSSVRPMLESVGGEWKVLLYRKRIDVIQNSRETNKDVFKERAMHILQHVMNIYGLTANGLALNVTCSKQGAGSNVYTKFVIPTPYYKENEPSEWTLNSSAQAIWNLAGASTQINVVTVLNRDYDDLKIQLYMNTVPNVSRQFDLEAMDGFLIQALSAGEMLLADLQSGGKLD